MGSKSKIAALVAMEEYTAYRWELLRRNADYRSEYDLDNVKLKLCVFVL